MRVNRLTVVFSAGKSDCIMKEIRLLGDLVRLKLQESNIPPVPYILAENIILLTITAKFSFYIPFSEDPITLQSLAVVMIGAIYGARAGGFGVGAYLLLGLLGLPVFGEHQAGFLYLTGPDAGFMIGQIAAAVAAGVMAGIEWDRDLKKAFALLVGCQGVIVFSGFLWQHFYMQKNITFEALAAPLMPGLVLKSILGAILLKMFWNTVIGMQADEESSNY